MINKVLYVNSHRFYQLKNYILNDDIIKMKTNYYDHCKNLPKSSQSPSLAFFGSGRFLKSKSLLV